MCYNLGMTTKKIRNPTWDINTLPEVVKNSECWVDVIRHYGLSDKSAGNWKTFQSYAKRMGLDTSHFVGRRSGRAKTSTDINELLVMNSDIRSSHLKTKLYANGLKKNVCDICGIDSWMGNQITMELDHINGTNTDNRIENLRILCPNCHSQTDTWRGRNKNKNGTKADVDAGD